MMDFVQINLGRAKKAGGVYVAGEGYRLYLASGAGTVERCLLSENAEGGFELTRGLETYYCDEVIPLLDGRILLKTAGRYEIK